MGVRGWGMGGVLALLLAALGSADLRVLATLDGASAYEREVLEYVRSNLAGRQEVDNSGSLTVTFGSGKPHTLLIAGLDEPGYVVSAITEDGYLRLHRLAATAPHHNFENFFLGQAVRVSTAAGKKLSGVVAAPSVHLQSERGSSARADHPENFYVDIGARSRREALEAGADLLDAVTLEKLCTELGDAGRLSAPWISGRAGAAILLGLGRRLAAAAPAGTVTLAFVSQQYSGHRGLARVAGRVEADRVVWIRPGGSARPAVAPASDERPQTADALAALAKRRKLDLDRDTAERLLVPAFASEDIWPRPERVASLTVGVEHPGTPVEVVSKAALENLEALLTEFAGIRGAPQRPPADRSPETPSRTTLAALVETYGVSGAEGRVRDAIRALLPEWARRASRVDEKGNLIVALAPKPERLFIAHMDELGFEVTEVQPDGKLWAETRGGGTPEFSEWHAGMLHTEKRSLPAILLGGFGGLRHRVQVDFGARSAAETAALGVKAGDTVSIRKKYRALLNGRVTARSLDDRAGCALLVETLRSLEPGEIRRPAWFVFSVQEEIGLKGAEFLAESVQPAEVYAIDTFVSSDSPLESQRIAGARLGDGFVIRAIDSSGITPRAAVMRVVELARRHGIPVQYGVTSGANDGSKFVNGGAVNVPLGWPLRYSHSPGEVADLADIAALGKIVRALAVE